MWRAVVLAYFVSAVGILGVRYLLLPKANDYRDEIAAAFGSALGLPVEIGEIETSWSGFRPRLKLADLVVRDRSGRAALKLARVDATVSWSSLLRLSPHFRLLEFFGPSLEVRREPDGKILIAGLPVDAGGGENGQFADWLLGQDEIVIHDAGLTWIDDRRGAPPLGLEQVQIRLVNALNDHHRFGLTARPSNELAGLLELRGDLVGADPASLSGWHGQLFARLEGAALGGWRSWIDYPVSIDGRGALNAWLTFDGARIVSSLIDLSLRSVRLQLDGTLPTLELMRLDGRIGGDFGPEGFSVSSRGLAMSFADGSIDLPRTDADLRISRGADGQPNAGHFAVNRLDVAALARLAQYLPLDAALHRQLAALAPDGQLSGVSLDWKGTAQAAPSWSVVARFDGIGFTAGGGWPGMAGLSGEIEGNDQSGRFTLASSGASIDLPDIFAESRLDFETLQAGGGWARREGKIEVNLERAEFSNSDAAGNASGSFIPDENGPGEIDLQARLTRADGTAVWRYMPLVVNEETRDWLHRSIVSGKAADARLRLRGNLANFPFRDGKDGQFLVTAKISNGRLEYAPGWPAIDGIDGTLRFEGAGMLITADRGHIGSVKLGRVTAELPDLDGDDILTIKGSAAGPTNGFLAFVNSSPVGERIDRFTEDITADGAGSLSLSLVMPLRDIEKTEVKGEYRFVGNAVRIGSGLPPLTDASARIAFTAERLDIADGAARMLGEPLSLAGGSRPDGGVAIRASGGFAAAALAKAFPSPLLAHLSGRASWQTDINVRGRSSEVVLRSDLQGIASSLPAPFNKSATDKLPLAVSLTPSGQGTVQTFVLSLGDSLKAEVLRRHSPDGWAVERGGAAIGAPLRQADGGVLVSARLPELDVDAWLRAIDDEAGTSVEVAGRDDVMATSWPIAGVNLQADGLKVFGEQIGKVELRATADPGGWKGVVSSESADGSFDWRRRDAGTLRARLSRLAIDPVEKGVSSSVQESSSHGNGAKSLPTLDVVAERFMLRGRELGRLELQARNREGVWLLDGVSLEGPEGSLRGDGRWRPGQRSELSVKVEAKDVGRYLAQFGYPDAVRRGKAILSGQFDWQGPPTQIDYPSLSGRFDVEASDGQFNKLEPGVGRLLGVLSLQALPRRITLDFRDVFSEGFAFDRVAGSARIEHGVMRTTDLEIRGPAAKVFMQGSVDLPAETQDLRVKVQPTLSESVAVGAALANAATGVINPVAGVVTYLAQKMLKDPVERFFAFEYSITGKWDDPQVKRVSGADAGQGGAARDKPGQGGAR
ncbi:MAG: YhdP family protein [Rhodocyclaceae bacterium]